MSDDQSRTRFRDKEFAAEYLGLPIWRIYSEAAAGRLPSRLVGRRLYFAIDDLEEYRERIRRQVTVPAGH